MSYDEKPGIQAIETTAPDLPHEPGEHATFAREHEYKRHGTVGLLAGIDLVTGRPPWSTSIGNPSFTRGPSSSTRRPDMIRISETMV
jgi:hypothetical protein